MEAQTIFCPHCQTPNPAKNLYCLACGKPLIQAAPAPDPVGYPNQAVALPPFYPQTPASQPAPVQVQGFPPQGLPPQQGAPGMSQQSLPPQGFQQTNIPAQQGYYPPPPPAPAPVPTAPSLEKLGNRKEEWLRLINNKADAADKVQKAFVDELQSHAIPMVTVEKIEFSAGFSKKLFQLVRHPAGSVVVAIDPVGKDLTLSWALYVPQIPRWTLLGILAGI
ncbi:MAG: hypothetical protein Q7U74_01895, partial [Saprospiraceae bacterium]|nr:hypothetical protein [Saprospiraceae bacterium]